MLDRRHLMLAAAGSVAGAIASNTALAANSVPPGPSLRRATGVTRTTVPYPDPNIQVVDPRFKKYIAGTTLLRRVWTGAEWTEGPVWFGDMHCVIFSDIPNNRLLSYDTMSGDTKVFRSPSNFTNGNTRDRQGRAG